MSTPGAGGVDWGVGRYEETAAELLPAAHIVVDHAGPAPEEHVVDIGCGTGNGALLAAQRGARVTGVDPAARLLDVAREQAAARGLEATFVSGSAAALPLPDATADVVMSVFGVIFAPDPAAAAAEIARVATRDARVILSAWIPEGGISAAARAGREAMREALGAPEEPPPFAWHSRDALSSLLAPHGFADIVLDEHPIAFTASSVRSYLEAWFQNHPLWVAGRGLLEARGMIEPLRERVEAIFQDANEDPDGFRMTSRYIVATARRR
jgi:SAM-dependent methyltransferase